MNSAQSQINIGGKMYVIESDDVYLTNIGSVFEPEMVRLFEVLITPDDCVFDVGANIGCTAILFSDLAKKVFAFEPSPTTFEFLSRNIARSGKGNVTLLNVGLGDSDGTFPLTRASNNRSGAFIAQNTSVQGGHVTESIKVRRLDDLYKEVGSMSDRVDFIKVDVEGFEAHVIKGGRETIVARKPMLVLELNHWCLNAFQRTSVPEFFDFLKSIFPILYAVDGDRFLDLHDTDQAYTVMYQHIIHMKFANIVCAYRNDQLKNFRTQFAHA